MRETDVLSFHCPLNAQTKHMLCEHTLPRTSEHPGLYVVNAARGGVVDEAVLMLSAPSSALGVRRSDLIIVGSRWIL